MTPKSHTEIVKELRRGFHARHEQMISRTGAGDVEQMAFGVVDFLQVGVVADGLDALLQGMTSSSQAITATARNSSPLARCMVLIDRWPLTVSTCSSRILNGSTGLFRGGNGPVTLGRGADEQADLVRQDARPSLARRASGRRP